MKVLVIGATGLTGRIATRLLLEQGDEVTAFARKPEAIERRDRLEVVVGEARDAGSIERAVQGHGAVLSAFGPRSIRRDDLQEVFMRNLVAAMEKTGVSRLSNLSAWGTGDSYVHLNLAGKIVIRTLLRRLFADKERGERILRASSLDFVNVRPGRLSNGPARGGVRASLDPKAVSPWPLMTRADLAGFMVEQLRSDTWVRRSPLIGY